MEIEIFRRKRGSKGQFMSHQAPLLKLEMPRGQVTVYKKTSDVMGLSKNDAIMFGFNRIKKVGYVFKEEPQEDSYYPRRSGRDYCRFTSKDLAQFMVDVFGLRPEDKQTYFEVCPEPNEKGMYEFKLKQ